MPDIPLGKWRLVGNNSLAKQFEGQLETMADPADLTQILFRFSNFEGMLPIMFIPDLRGPLSPTTVPQAYTNFGESGELHVFLLTYYGEVSGEDTLLAVYLGSGGGNPFRAGVVAIKTT